MTNHREIFFISILFLGLFPSFSLMALAHKSKPIILSGEYTYYYVCHYAEYLQDDKDDLTIRELSSPEYANSFRPMNSNGFIPKQKQIIWLRFTVENKTKSQNEWLLEYDFFKSYIKLEFYLPRENSPDYDKLTFSGIHGHQAGIPYRNYLVRLSPLPGSSKTYYLKATVSTDHYLVLKIWHPAAFITFTRTEQLLIGIFSGIMGIMAIYNFFLFLSFKDKSYIYYIFFILSLSILQLNNHQLIAEWLPVFRQYDVIITTIFKLLSVMCFLFFSRSFLPIKKNLPVVDKSITLLIYAITGTGLLSFSFTLFKTINSLLLALSGILMLISAIILLKKKNRPALFFLLAMVALIGFGVLVLIPADLYYTKVIDLFVPYFIDFGSLTMIILFSFGLGYRINQLHKEKEQIDRLKELDSLKSRFFANISHEFRTPLTLITGPLEDMYDECKNPEQKKKYRMMIRNSERLLCLINQLLELSRLESGKMVLKKSGHNIVSFLKGILENFAYIAEQNNQQLIFQADDEPVIVPFDHDKMEQVCLNLFINALKFTPPGERIIVSIMKKPQEKIAGKFPDGYVELKVTNTGIDISRENLPYIFEQFYQTENTPQLQHIGSGLGLALAKELIKLHHGSLEVKSSSEIIEKQKYTTFIVRLPWVKHRPGKQEIPQVPFERSRSPLNAAVADMIANKNSNNTTCTAIVDNRAFDCDKNIILIIEDNTEIRKYISDGLTTEYTVIEAACGQEGLNQARQVIPDLVISDIMMPGMDGYEVCCNLKKEVETSHIPVILLTAKAADENMIKGLEYGADDYITKPFNLKKVAARIKNLIALRHRLQEKIQKELLLQPVETTITPVDQRFMQNLNDTIEKNIADQNFSIEVLAANLFLSKATLNRKIRALTGQSSNQYIQSYRLKVAARLLESNFGNVTEVSYLVGFSSSAYFTKCFKEVFHELPSHYQKG